MQLLLTQLDGTVLLSFTSCMTVGYHWETSLFLNMTFPVFLLSYHMGSQDISAMQWTNGWIYHFLTRATSTTVQNLLPVLTSRSVFHMQTNKVCHSMLCWCTIFPMPVGMKGLYSRQQSKWTGRQLKKKKKSFAMSSFTWLNLSFLNIAFRKTTNPCSSILIGCKIQDLFLYLALSYNFSRALARKQELFLAYSFLLLVVPLLHSFNDCIMPSTIKALTSVESF